MTCPNCTRAQRENDALRVDLSNSQAQNLALMRRLDDKKTTKRQDEQRVTAEANEFLGYWRSQRPEHRDKGAVESRVKRVQKWLNHKSLAELKLAVDGAAFSPWHMGRNKDRKTLTDVRHILANEELIDELIELGRTNGASRRDGYTGPRGVQVVLSRLEDVRQVDRAKWVARCPSHDDHKPSLDVSQGREGALLICRAGCDTNRVLDALGLPKAALFDREPIPDVPVALSPVLPSLGQLQAWHRQLLSNEPVLGRVKAVKGWDVPVLRFFGIGWNPAEKRLMIPAFSPEAELRGVLRYRPKDPDKMLVAKGSKRDLFPLPEFLAKRWVLLAEGEPDAVSGRQHGLPTIAMPGVPYAKTVEKWAPRFKDRKVAVCFDCDDPGREAAEKVGHGLAGVARDVRVVDLDSSRSDGWDLSDALIGGVSARELCDRVRSASAVVRWAA